MKILPLLSLVACTLVVHALPSLRRTSKVVVEELEAAVHAADGAAVARLTDELKVLVPASPASPVSLRGKSDRERQATKLVTLRQHSAAQKEDTREVEKKREEKALSIFDDRIFNLSAVARKELQKQLDSPQAQEALLWAQTGGFYICAYEGQPCECAGNVKYGAPHMKKWSAEKPVKSSVLCSVDIFGDPAPGMSKSCYCHRTHYELTLHENSGSLLQESWIFTLRFLAHMKWLPFTGDRTHHGLDLWSARHGGVTGGTLERYWIEKYVVEMYSNIPAGNCLEWGLYYVNFLNQCTHKYENRYEAVKYGQKKPSVEGNIVYSSIYDFPGVMAHAHLQFNFICATELFEHLEKPYEASRDLYEIMAPGGAVLFTAPQQAQYHQVPQDFLRYTKEGAKHIMEVAGFCVPPQLMAGSGDFIFDVGRNVGLQIQDFTIEEMDAGYQRGYDNIADGAITIHAMAFKPPHHLCQK
jgi:hypothetical protein